MAAGIEVLRGVLRVEAGAVALSLLGEPNRSLSSARELRWGRKGSIALRLDGERRGVWFDHSTSEGGDLLDLIRRESGGDFKAALEWAKRWIGMEDRPVLPIRREPTPALSDPDGQQRAEAARSIWRDGVPAGGTLVQTYLFARGITLPPPATVRYHPGLKHQTGLILPAMVGAVACWPGNSVTAVHRTFLRLDGREKAPLSQAKMMLGRVSGGAVRLAPAGPRLIVAEGIETALAAMQASGLPGWAALSAGGIEALVLPPLVAEVFICADHDKSGRGQEAAEKAATRWVSEGRTVRIAMPPDAGTDFADLVRGAA